MQNTLNNPIKKSEIHICPKCQNGCKLSTDGYNITTSCKCGHKSTYTLIDFDQTQYIESKNIQCNRCFQDKNEDECSYCLKCKNNYCNNCINFIYSEIGIYSCEHYIVPYYQKEYFCKDHNELFESFCSDCQQNLCIQCIQKHMKHNIKVYDLDKEQRKQNVNISDILFSKLDKFILDFINKVNSIRKAIRDSYKIYREINLNYGNIRTWENLSNQNAFDLNFIIKDFKKIIKIAENENNDLKFFESINILYIKNKFKDFASSLEKVDEKPLKKNSIIKEIEFQIFRNNFELINENEPQNNNNNDYSNNNNSNNNNNEDNSNNNLSQDNSREFQNDNPHDIYEQVKTSNNENYPDDHTLIYDKIYQQFGINPFDGISSVNEKSPSKKENESTEYYSTEIEIYFKICELSKINEEIDNSKISFVKVNKNECIKIQIKNVIKDNVNNNNKNRNNKNRYYKYNCYKMRLKFKLSLDGLNFNFVSKIIEYIFFINSKLKFRLNRQFMDTDKNNINVKYLADEFYSPNNDLFNYIIISSFNKEKNTLFISYLNDGVFISFKGKEETMMSLKYPYGFLLANILHKFGV